jgi:hypothetical protein
LGKAFQLGNATVFGLEKPCIQVLASSGRKVEVRRTYDQAQTPMQRLLASGVFSAKKQQELLGITEALDPVRLLQQLEHATRRPFGNMPSRPLLRASSPQPRFSFLCSSCLQKRCQLMAFLGPLHLCSKRSEEKRTKKLGAS